MLTYIEFLALPFIGTLGSLMPIFLTAAHSYQHGEFLWYMPAVVAAWDSRAAKFFVSCAMILAIIGNQVAAGSYPFSNDITGFAPKYINIFRGTLFMIVFCFVSNPWSKSILWLIRDSRSDGNYLPLNGLYLIIYIYRDHQKRRRTLILP